MSANQKLGKKPALNFQKDSAEYAGIPRGLEKKDLKGKAGVRKTLELVQQSTASMGRFDEKRQGEPTQKLSGKKRSYKVNIGSSGLADEKASMKANIKISADKIDKKVSMIYE